MFRSKLLLLAVAAVLLVGASALATPLTPYEQAVIASGPVVYYPCNDASGQQVAVDLSGNGNNGQYGNGNGNTGNNAVTLGASISGLSGMTANMVAELTPSGGFGSYASATPGSCLCIPAITAMEQIGLGDFTVEEWFSANSAGSRFNMFEWNSDNGASPSRAARARPTSRFLTRPAAN